MKHLCHWPGCTHPVPPRMWGCPPHWFALPTPIRIAIWKAYVRGQEARKDPSPEYMVAAHAAREWALSAAGLRPVPPAAPLVLDPGPRGPGEYCANWLHANGLASPSKCSVCGQGPCREPA